MVLGSQEGDDDDADDDESDDASDEADDSSDGDESDELVPIEAAADRGEGRPFSEALSRPGTSLIAEYKRRSPSAGAIRPGAQP